MTITVPLWLIISLIFAVGFVTASVVGRQRGAYDFASPFLGFIVFLGSVILALVVALIAKW